MAEGLKSPFLLSLIPTLNDQNYNDFFESLETTAKLAEWSKEQLLVITKLKMEGAVRKLYNNSLEGKVTDYESLKKGIKGYFTPTTSFAQNFAAFSTAEQNTSETARDFAMRIEGLAKLANLPIDFKEKVKMSQYINGLKPALKAQVILLNPLSFDEAIEISNRVENSLQTLSSNVNALNTPPVHKTNDMPNDYVNVLTLLTKQISEMQIQINELAAANINKVQKITCNYCQIVGHKENECRKKKRANLKNRPNHNRYQQPTQFAINQQHPFVVPRQNSRSSFNHQQQFEVPFQTTQVQYNEDFGNDQQSYHQTQQSPLYTTTHRTEANNQGGTRPKEFHPNY